MSNFDSNYFDFPTVALVNEAKTPLGFDLATLADILYRQMKWHFYPIWGLKCKVIVADKVPTGCWGMIFLDNADQAGALGYHDITVDGLPESKVFVQDAIKNHSSITVTASHEIMEMLVDPAINLCASKNDGSIYAYEVADAVEETTYMIDKTEVSNFVFPTWFEEFRTNGKFDYLGKVTAPFQLLSGGYAPVFKNGSWTQIFGSMAKGERFAREDRRGHRSEFRKLGTQSNMGLGNSVSYRLA